MQVKIGTYTGNGSSNSVTGVGFQPDLVIVKSLSAAVDTQFKTSQMSSNNSLPIRSDGGFNTDRITSLDSDGFSLGNATNTNQNTHSYAYLAVKDNGAGDFKVGVFTGDGNDGLAITGLGFQPAYVLIKTTNSVVGASAFTSATVASFASMQFSGPNRSDSIVSLDSDGFTVNNGSSSGGNLVNISAVPSHYFAFKAVSGYVSVFSYTGNGADDRDITTPGFAPGWIHIKGESSNAPRIRFSVQSGDLSETWDAAPSADGIQGFSGTGFQVGTDSSVNTNAQKYNALVIGADFTTGGATASWKTFGDEGLIS